jgi:hypothetical protein
MTLHFTPQPPLFSLAKYDQGGSYDARENQNCGDEQS